MQYTPLRFRRLWLWLGILGLGVLSILALWPYQMDQGLPRWTDKAVHAAAFMIIAAWFFQIYHQHTQRLALGLILFTVGFAIELAQYYSPPRCYGQLHRNRRGLVIVPDTAAAGSLGL